MELVQTICMERGKNVVGIYVTIMTQMDLYKIKSKGNFQFHFAFACSSLGNVS